MTVRDLGQLARPGICLAVGGATLLGAIVAGGGEPMGVGAAVLGAMALCAGCSALNQIQEIQRDALMLRTCERPLPAGRVKPWAAMAVAIALMSLGLGLFLVAGGAALALVGVAVVVLYNGAYTPLKTRTSLALLVGGVAGALPPLCGWVAAGGALSDPLVWTLSGVVYLWQVPHFWLLAEKRREQYQQAGFVLLSASLGRERASRLTGLWILAYFTGLAWAAGLCESPSLGALALAVGVFIALAAATGRRQLALGVVNGSLVLALVGIVWVVSISQGVR